MIIFLASYKVSFSSMVMMGVVRGGFLLDIIELILSILLLVGGGGVVTGFFGVVDFVGSFLLVRKEE